MHYFKNGQISFVFFSQVAFSNLYQTGSASDKCTLYNDRNLINRRNVKSDVSDSVNACRRFFQLAVEARVVAGCLNVLDMASLDGTLSSYKFSGDQNSDADKKDYLTKVASMVVDRLVKI